jgi:hypothetical protein
MEVEVASWVDMELCGLCVSDVMCGPSFFFADDVQGDGINRRPVRESIGFARRSTIKGCYLGVGVRINVGIRVNVGVVVRENWNGKVVIQ